MPGRVSRGQRRTGLRFLARKRGTSSSEKLDSDSSPFSSSGRSSPNSAKSSSNDDSNSGNSSSGSSNSAGSGKSGSSGSSGSSSDGGGTSSDGNSSSDAGSSSDDDGSSSSDGGSSSSSNSGSGVSSNGGSGSLSSSSAKPSGTAPPPSPPCILHCVPDNDPRVLYSPSWSINSQGFFRTSHQTDVAGSWLRFDFNGSAITVYGSIPASNATHLPPTAVYSMDAAKPFTTAEPMATQAILNQPLFSASQLSRDTHSLFINVTNVQTASPFSIDYFIVLPSTPSLPSPLSPSASASASGSAVSPKSSLEVSSGAGKVEMSQATVGILAGVLGSVIFILLGVSLFFYVIIRRRRMRAHRSKSFQSSLFTTSESILMWSRTPSQYSRGKTQSGGGNSISEKSRSAKSRWTS